jgi:hypothetical protein
MTHEQAAAAWRRELRRVAPSAPAALQQWVAEQLASDVGPDALEQLADHLVRIAGVLAEEAVCRVRRTAEVVQLRRHDRSPDDFPPAAA